MAKLRAPKLKVGDRVRIHITFEESSLDGVEGTVTALNDLEGYDVQMDGDAISHSFDPSELVKIADAKV